MTRRVPEVVLVLVVVLALARAAEAAEDAPEAAREIMEEVGVAALFAAFALLATRALAGAAFGALGISGGAVVPLAALAVAVAVLWRQGIVPLAGDALGVDVPTFAEAFGGGRVQRDGPSCPPGTVVKDAQGRVERVCLGFERPEGFGPTP